MKNKNIKIFIDGVVIGEVENFSYQEIKQLKKDKFLREFIDIGEKMLKEKEDAKKDS